MEKFETGEEAPKNLLQELQAKNPDRNVAFTAIEDLKSPEEIKQFFQQYIKWLKEVSQEDPENVARQNIGYIVGYYSKETAERWMKVLPDISHPVFGKDIPFTDTQSAYEKGKENIEK